MKTTNRKRRILFFVISLCLILAILAAAVLMNKAFNQTWHTAAFTGETLFSPRETAGVSVTGVARGSTWTKVFDFHNEGLTEHNYQAYTYDFTVTNNTRYAVEDFSFCLTFHRDVYLMSGWNGALEIHQFTDGGELADTVADLRVYDPAAHSLQYVIVDGEPLVVMHDVDKGAHYHHERYDGKGYPDGLAGEDIPLVARMICVADSFDAMNTNRVYRKKLSTDTIISELESNKGRQFDPQVADVMLRLIREGRVPVDH